MVNVQFPDFPFSQNLFLVIVGSLGSYQTKSKVNPKFTRNLRMDKNISFPFLAVMSRTIPISNIVLTIFYISGDVFWYTRQIKWKWNTGIFIEKSYIGYFCLYNKTILKIEFFDKIFSYFLKRFSIEISLYIVLYITKQDQHQPYRKWSKQYLILG